MQIVRRAASANRSQDRAAASSPGAGRRHGRKRTRLHSRQSQDAGRRSPAPAVGSSRRNRTCPARARQRPLGTGPAACRARQSAGGAGRSSIGCGTITLAPDWCALVDDFGVMGQPPTHPELLDYLAGELMREGWSLKQLHRQIVLSNTYRMSSQAAARGRSRRSAQRVVAPHARCAGSRPKRFATPCWRSPAGSTTRCTAPA